MKIKNIDYNFDYFDLHIEIKDLKKYISKFYVGQKIYLTGYVYTARDAAHKRLVELIKAKKKLPIDIKDSVIYYTGPTPARPKMVIGSCGPTSSYRMDQYLNYLLELGLLGTIGKGERSEEAVGLIKKYKAVYFSAIGGAGALACKYVEDLVEVAFLDLGCESIKKIYIKDFPLIVSVV
ncbi:MAG: fumarate hydratase C-terminal domain-containing protein [Oscillospiraceae bacterium]|nr:fumarate hydratase C-terminal domain-containing protein [Oscillospiraceae bacterium]